jgi:hypothetical protein
MIGLMLRGFFLIGIISVYSHSVFKMINDYFRSEYKTYLTDEMKRNKFLVPNEEIAKDNRADQRPPSFALPDRVVGDETKASLAAAAECSELNCIENRRESNANDNESEKSSDDSSNSGGDESAMVNYWLAARKRNNYDGKNDDAHCHVEKCKDN